MMTSQKQIEANQQNAQKSTGPKTEEGKAIAKLNSVKHGILSEAVVITKGEGQERKDAYLRLHDGLRDYFKPDGAMEEVLVEKIMVCLWRKRRVLRFELGCLRKQLDAYQEDHRDEDESLQSSLEEVQLCRDNIETLKSGCDIMSDAGAEHWTGDYERLAAHQDYPGSGYGLSGPQARDWLKKRGFTEDQIRQALIQAEEDRLQKAEPEARALEAKLRGDLDRAPLLGSLPADERDLDKIIRYEASLDRQLYKAINQLERLQRRHAGEQLPPPVVLDET
jgi:hypothetical protein